MVASPTETKAAPVTASTTADPPAKTEPATTATAKPEAATKPIEAEAKLARPQTSVFLRTNPVAIAATGTTIGGLAAWHPDLLTIGVGFGKLEFLATLTAQNLFPDVGALGARYGRLSAQFRPLRKGDMPVLDAYVYGGVGFGGIGTYEKTAGCTGEECGTHFSSYGGDIHGGVGLDFHKKLLTLPSQQGMYLFVGFDLRPTVLLNGPDGAMQFFMVYSFPVGIRWN